MKPKIKISPSMLETYRSFCEGRYEGTQYETTAEKLIANIKGERVYTQALTTGSAFHKLLEDGTKPYKQDDGTCLVPLKEWGSEEVRNIAMSNYYGRVADRFRELNPALIHEIPLSMEMEVSSYTVKSFMRMDALSPFPLKLHDFKTTSKQYGMVSEWEYYHSVQWRMYLIACDDVDDFQYDIFHFLFEPDSKPMAYYNFLFSREIDMENVVGDLMMGFISFCEDHNLLDYITLKEKNKPELIGN